MGASFRQTVKRRSSRPLITDLKQLKTGAAGVLFRAAIPLFSLHRPRAAHAASALPFRPTTDEQVAVEGLPGRPFKTLAVTTVAATFGLVVLGGVVRLTDSGLGCPDWPLCHGQLIPPADKATLIEYSHRLLASVVGVLAVATSVIVWVKWRHVRWMSVPAALGVVLLVGQGLLGGFTVLRELPGELVLAHLATAEALIACYVIVALVALVGPQPGGASRGIVGDKFVLAVLATALLNYGLILSGSYVTVSGAATACGESWPLCNGLPHGLLPSIHMGHRFVALVAGLAIVGVVAAAWNRRSENPALGYVAAFTAAAFLVQILLGAGIVWEGFPLSLRLTHLAIATLMWLGLVAMAYGAVAGPLDEAPRTADA